MKTSKHDASTEKRILTGMIVNDTVISRIASRWRDDGLFRVQWANKVGGWCVRYFARYGKAPRADIEGLFESWAERASDENTVELVDRFLAGLSEDYEEESKDINPSYLVDIAGEHFNAVALERMADVVRGHLDRGDVTKAVETTGKWNRVDLGVGAGIDLLHDREAVEAAFTADVEPLIKYPGALGQFFGNQLARDEFVAITGASGRGKTWWLLDLAWMAVRQGHRAAFFEVGDMSQNQIIRRFMCRASGWPTKPPYEIDVPVSIDHVDGETMAAVARETRTFSGPLDYGKAWEACRKKTRRHKKPLLRLSVHPNTSINVEGVCGVLDVWEREGWVPDVVVIDYADILSIPQGYQKGDRDAIDETWKQLRNLSQVRHILVVTATQGDADSYNAHTIRRGNFSNDRRKNDHVTAMLGINATEEEQEEGIFRLNWTKRREEAYVESRCVHVASCLHLGRPHVKSTF